MTSLHLTYIANARFPSGRAHGIQIAKMWEAFVTHNITVNLFIPRRFPYDHGSAAEAVTFYTLMGAPSFYRIHRVPLFVYRRAHYFGFLIGSFFFGIISTWRALRQSGVIYSVDLDYFSFFLIPFLRKPYFFEIHSAKKDTFFHRLLFKHISGVIAINDNVKEALIKTFPTLTGKVIVCPNGVDVERYGQDSFDDPVVLDALRLTKGIKTPSVVYTGSFQDWKGLGTVIDAALELPSVHFYLVGGTKEELGEGKNAIPPNVHIVALQPFSEIGLWQRGADILLLTGTKESEYSFRYTSPMKLFEYMAARRPIVAAQTPAIESIVTEKEVWFFKPDDADDLVRVIGEVIHGMQNEIKVAAAFARAQELSWNKRAERIISFIQERL